MSKMKKHVPKPSALLNSCGNSQMIMLASSGLRKCAGMELLAVPIAERQRKYRILRANRIHTGVGSAGSNLPLQPRRFSMLPKHHYRTGWLQFTVL